MKKSLQLFLVFILMLLIYLIYKNYFYEEKISSDNKKIFIEKKNDTSQTLDNNNKIKNLSYEVNLDMNEKYIITSKSSVISYDNNIELVDMDIVNATYYNKKNFLLEIYSDKAFYNKNNYNTTFEKNVTIKYIGNLIKADKLKINFKEKIVSLHDNVEYFGENEELNADNIIINLITGKIDILSNFNKNIVFKNKSKNE